MKANSKAAIGIDLGGTSIKYAVVLPDGAVLWESRRPSQARHSAGRIIQHVIDAATEAREAALALGSEPVCIGIGTPGIVDVQTGTVLGGADNLADWEQIPLADLVQKAVGLPVFVDNDAKLMGLGEYAYGGNQHYRHLLFFTIGTGIGGAIFIHGQLYRGRRNAAGEFGSIMMRYRGQDAYWEEFASTAAMVGEYRRRVEDPDLQQPADGRYIFDRYRQGEPLATEVVLEHARLVGYGVAGYINVFNPERIVIGGGISEAGEDYIQLIDAAARKYAMRDCSEGVEIVAARLGNKAGFLGAARFALSGVALDE